MPSNLVPNLSQHQLKTLHKLLQEYAKHIEAEQPLAAEVLRLVAHWVKDDIE